MSIEKISGGFIPKWRYLGEDRDAEATIALLDDKVDSLELRLAAYIKDIKVISEALLEEATDRGWCDQYNNFVDDVNKSLQLSSLEKMETEFEFTVSLKRVGTATETVTITATTEDDARQQIENMDFDDLESMIGYVDWDEDDVEITDIDL